MKWGELSSSLGESFLLASLFCSLWVELVTRRLRFVWGEEVINSWKPHGSSIFFQALVSAEVLVLLLHLLCAFCGPYFLCIRRGSQSSGMAEKFAFRAFLIA